jgi:hypothetical protein
LRKNAAVAGPKDSDGNSGRKLGSLNSGRRIESEPDPNSITTQYNGRAGGTVPRAAKVDESTEAERQRRRRKGKKEIEERRSKKKMKKDTNGREEPNGRPPDLET